MTRNNHDSIGLSAQATISTNRHVLLVGVPGSGKSTILRRLVEENPTATAVNVVDASVPYMRDALTRPNGGLVVVDDAALMSAFAASVLTEVIDGGHISGTIVMAAETEAVLPASVVAKHITVVQVEDLVGRRLVRNPDGPGGWKEGTTTETLAALVAIAREKETRTGPGQTIDEVVSGYVIEEDDVVDEDPRGHRAPPCTRGRG